MEYFILFPYTFYFNRFNGPNGALAATVNFTKQLNCGWNGLSSKVDLKNKENIKSLAAISSRRK